MRPLRAPLSLGVLCWLTAAAAPAAVDAAPVAVTVTPEPQAIRVDTGTHSDTITALASDGRVLLTASSDGTARLWDLRGGAPRGTLRPPQDAAPGDGSLHAAALSSDGRRVFVAGYTQFYDLGRSQGSSTYVFERSGELLRRIPGERPRRGYATEEIIRDLSLSPDGQRLAVARLSGGANVYLAGSGAALRGAESLEGLTLDHDGAGRLYVASGGGNQASAEPSLVRRYDLQMNLVTESDALGARQPSRLRVSPDGGRVAVIATPKDQGVPQVLLLSGPDLTTVAELPFPGEPRALSFRGPGRLCVGGADPSGGAALRCFRDLAGRKPTSEPIVKLDARAPLTALLALPGNALAWASAEPAFGVLEASGKARFVQRPEHLDLQALPAAQRVLRVSADGDEVTVPIPGASLTYKVKTGALTRGKVLEPQPAPPPGPDLKTVRPTQALARMALPAGAGAVAAWEDGVGLFGPAGKQREFIITPAAPRALAVSADGRFVVVALSDGTLRWYRVADGKERLALFLHRDGRRSAAWTPAGAYAASVGAEDLLGFLQNPQGQGAARFVPVRTKAQDYYRPAEVAAALAEDPAPATRPLPDPKGRDALLRKVPKLTVVDPSDGSSVEGALTLKVRVEAGGPAPGLRVSVDGRPVSATVNMTREAGDVLAVALTLPPGGGTRTISVVAEGGVPAVVRVEQPAPATPAPEDRPRLWMLAVGVSRYARPELAMTPDLAARDARELAALLGKQKVLYREVSTRVLVDAEATRDRVLDGLEWLARAATVRDVAVLQLAGHGVNDPETGQYYFLPHDADPEHLLRSAIAGTTLQSALGAIPGRVLLFLDTCHAGNAMNRGSGDFTRFVNDLSGAERGVVVMTSALGRQLAQEAPEWGHGAFTKAILEALGGKADFRAQKRVSLAALDLYVSDRVRELTHGEQTPVLARPITVPDFPLVLLP